jgi:uncharacterized phage protein (TIGR01671 family)
MNNRIIKFRAWDKHSKYMYSPEEIESIGNHDDEYERLINLTNNGQFHHLGGHYARPLDTVELMQFTGFKDKNSKEIYEGDIIQDINKEDVSYIVVWNPNDGMWSLVTNIKQKPSTIKWDNDLCLWNGDSEVIGNVFENPELIKK